MIHNDVEVMPERGLGQQFPAHRPPPDAVAWIDRHLNSRENPGLTTGLPRVVQGLSRVRLRFRAF
jgi:hypothetical protein